MTLKEYVENNEDAFYGNGSSIEEIEITQKKLGLVFSKDYIEYLKNYSIMAINGIELTGLVKDTRLNVVSVTNKIWANNELIPHNLYVIEELNIDHVSIVQSSDGTIYSCIPNNSPVKIASSLLDYISNC